MITINEVIIILFTYFLGDKYFLSNYNRAPIYSELIFWFCFFILNLTFESFRLLKGKEFFLNVAVFYSISENIIFKMYDRDVEKIKSINIIKSFVYISVILYLYSLSRQ